MKIALKVLSFSFVLISCFLQAQEIPKPPKSGEKNPDKFKQMYDLLATPNMYRTASGAPGPEYYQQQADYKIDVELDDKNTKLFGKETITYTNNAKESLDYLWVQLDQNQQSRISVSPLQDGKETDPAIGVQGFSRKYLEPDFDGGFTIEYVKDALGKPMKYAIQSIIINVIPPFYGE